MNGKGVWKPATTGYSPSNENSVMKRYLEGGFVSEKSEGEDFWGV
jgi:hypothetical protein